VYRCRSIVVFYDTGRRIAGHIKSEKAASRTSPRKYGVPSVLMIARNATDHDEARWLNKDGLSRSRSWRRRGR
jgi:hypothetical protein